MATSSSIYPTNWRCNFVGFRFTKIFAVGFVAGISAGIFAAQLFFPSLCVKYPILMKEATELISEMKEKNVSPLVDLKILRTVQSTIKKSPGRILCWILTSPKSHSRAQLVTIKKSIYLSINSFERLKLFFITRSRKPGVILR